MYLAMVIFNPPPPYCGSCLVLYFSFGDGDSQDDIVSEFNYKTLNFLLTKSTLKKKKKSELVTELPPSNDERDCEVASELRNHSSGNCTSGNCLSVANGSGRNILRFLSINI